MFNTILISVLTTVKNANEFIRESLESVYNQTYKNYEHIIVDDGSTDDTVVIINDFMNEFKDHKIKMILTKGIGRSAALNLGVSNSGSDWIAIIDGDDLWHPQKLLTQVHNIKNEIDVLVTGSSLFQKTNDILFGDVSNITLMKISNKMLLRSNQLSHSTAIIKKSLCLYDETRLSQLDYELWLRLISADKGLYKIDVILGYHRIHQNQSFEGKQGKIYRWRSFKLKFYYSLISRDIFAAFYNVVKLTFDLLLPRQFRLFIRNVING